MPAKTAPQDKTATYKQSFDSAIEELAELMTEREEVETRRERIERRINLIREAIMGFAWLCGKSSYEVAKERPELFPDNVSPDVGFTDAIRSVFRDDRDSFYSAIGVRDYLDFVGFDIAKYKNVLASIHSILKRLHKKGEIVEGTKDGKVVYKCNPRGPLATDPEPKAEPELSDDDIPF